MTGVRVTNSIGAYAAQRDYGRNMKTRETKEPETAEPFCPLVTHIM